VKHVTTSIITIAALASLVGCAAPVSSSEEETGQTEQASSTGGISASLSVVNKSGNNANVSITVTNNSNGTASNWQVGVNVPNGSVASVNGGEVADIGGVWTINPGPNGKALGAGASYTFTFQASYSGSYVAPTIASVDGEANGAAGVSPDGVDHIARTAASGALGVAFQYENNKLANDGDPNYAYYDGLIWAAQSYVVQNGQIVFDSNVPGYKFIPPQAKAALATIQEDPSVAEYLVTGLVSCLNNTNGWITYYFDAATLKGFPTTKSGSIPGGPVPSNDTKPNPYNPVDTYTVAESAGSHGSQIITITEKSTNDMYFGLLTTQATSIFPGYAAVEAKFSSGGGTVPCSPFNGPGGGTANPYLVITLNGQPLPARQANVGAQCNNGCTSTLVVDPIAYTIPGAQYDQNNNLLGPQNNPFILEPTDLYADPSHQMQFSTNPAAQYGTFSKSMNILGEPVEKWQICGTQGAGC
jgi:hypothetical protein